MKNKRKNDKKILLVQYIVGSLVLICILTFSGLYIMELARQPYRLARENATELARQYADLEEMTSFSIYNGKESYDSLLGKNKEGQEIGVLIAKESHQIYVYQLASGTSQEQARQIASENGAGKIDHVTLGYLDGQPIWEVRSGTRYYNIGFETASLLSREGL